MLAVAALLLASPPFSEFRKAAVASPLPTSPLPLSTGVERGSGGLEARIDKLISEMTLEEKISLCHGGGAFNTAGIPRLGIPEYKVSDGPFGVRYPWNVPSTGFATGVSIAATFDKNLIQKVGESIGEETLAKGNAVILGPGVNIVRTPIGGRSFEYYGEDPFLAGQIGVAFIRGVQSRGVAACVKHYAANSIERQRNSVDAQMDERTLREIYLPAFEAAVKDGHVQTVMAAYNKVNGQYSSENQKLQNDILKKEWGFQGYVMSDWGAVHTTIPSAMNGMDLEMPGGNNNLFATPLLTAVKDGKVPVSVIDDKVRRFLRVMLPIDIAKPANPALIRSKEHLAVAQRLAEEAMVLLKNDREMLPLKRKGLKNVVVIGPDADHRMSNGGGSAMVNATDEVTPYEGIKTDLGAGVKVTHINGTEPNEDEAQAVPSDVLQTEDGKPGLTGQYFGSTPPGGFRGGPGTPTLTRVDSQVDFGWGNSSPADGMPKENYGARWSGYLVPKISGSYFLGIKNDDTGSLALDGQTLVTNSDGWGEHPSVRVMKPIELVAGKKYAITMNYRHRTDPSEMRLVWAMTPGGVNGLIARATMAAKAADAVILVVGTNHAWDGESHDKPTLNLFDNEDQLTSEVLRAQPKTVVTLVNGTAVEMPWISQASTVLEAWYGGSRAGTALARILFGEISPSGKLPLTFPVKLADNSAHALGDYPPVGGALKYSDGILVGYRWFDTKRVRPLFPFGHGLSYTTFEYSDLKANTKKDGVNVRFAIANNGSMKAIETPQVYVRAKGSSVPRAMQELKGFTKVSLAPGASSGASVDLPLRAFAYYSPEKSDWVVEPGDYEIAIGSSSRDIRLTTTIHLR